MERLKTVSGIDLSVFELVINPSNFKALENISGIYVFISDKPIQRLIGESPILKIGQTRNLKRRISAYFREDNFEQLKFKKSRQTAYRLSRYLSIVDNYGLLFMPIEIKELKLIEKELIEKYYMIHYESPPLNMGMS